MAKQRKIHLEVITRFEQERERARKTAVHLEQALAAAESDLELAMKKIEELSNENRRIDDALIKTELKSDEEVGTLRQQVEFWRNEAMTRSEQLQAAQKELEKARAGDLEGKFVTTVADLTVNHIGAVVKVHIDSKFWIIDKLVALTFREGYGTVADVAFETAGIGGNGVRKGYAVDLTQAAEIVEPAVEELPF
ncbi:hypothetical protein [Gulosibacter faecalis]|uniref:Uncharacterized protein n=1 Tax=Gulosibacter faecalis TaxID=272240 RepID=A0ABW5UUK0_9MICO|nr:hypothetical protein [Gulosibacter faecalis]